MQKQQGRSQPEDDMEMVGGSPGKRGAEPSTGPEVTEHVSGSLERLGLVGFPNSGKTSWLYALVNGHRSYSIKRGGSGHARGQRSWFMGAVHSRFAALVGREGAAQPGTPRGVFQPSRFCEMKRSWLGVLPISSKFALEIPEVAGETVRAIAEGGRYINDAERASAQKYLDFLGSCGSILCLVGIDGEEHGGNLAVAESLSTIQGFERLLGEAITRRSNKRTPLAVTVLITKIDLIKSVSAWDEVSLPRARSAVAALSTAKGYEGLESQLQQSGSDETTVRFLTNRLMRSKIAIGDLTLQECIAADFVRCHAPQAAKQLQRLAGIPGIDLRFYLCAPYGFVSRNADNEAVYPSPGKINPTMVYEPLEDLMERSWQSRSGARLRRNLLFAIVIALLAIWLGPLSLSDREKAFDAAIREGVPWTDARNRLAAIEDHALFSVEQLASESRRLLHARRLIELRNRMLQGGRPADDGEITQLEDRAYELDRDATVASSGQTWLLRDLIAVRKRRNVEDYLKGVDIAKPIEVDLSGTETVNLVRSLTSMAEASREPTEWAALEARLGDFNLITGDRNSPIRITPAADGVYLVSELARLRAKASVRAKLDDEAWLQGAPAAEVAKLIEDAARAGDHEGVNRIEQATIAKLGVDWAQQLAPALRGDPDPGLSQFLARTGEVAWAEPMRRSTALMAFEAWMAASASRLVSDRAALDKETDLDKQCLLVSDIGARLQGFQSTLSALRMSHGWLAARLDQKLLDVLGDLQVNVVGVVDRVKRDPSNLINVNKILGDFGDVAGRSPSAWNVTYTDSTGASSSFELAWVVNEARDILKDLLNRRLLQLVRQNTRESAAEARGLQEVLDRNRISGTSGGVQRGFIAALGQIYADTPEAAELRATMKPVLADDNQLREVVPLLSMAIEARKSFNPEVVLALLEGIEAGVGARNGTRRGWVDKSWFAFAKEIVKHADQFSAAQWARVVDVLCNVGVDPDQAGDRLIADLMAGLTPDLVPSRERHMRDVFKAVSRRAQPGEDLGPQVFSRIIERIRQGFRSAENAVGLASQVDMDLKVLQNVDSPGVKTLLRSAQEHCDRIKDWKLIKVRSNGAPSYWYAPSNWSVADCASVARKNQAAFVQLIRLDQNFPFKSDGSRRLPTPNGVNEPADSLRINFDQARLLLEACGLRLPTVAEYNIAPRNDELNKVRPWIVGANGAAFRGDPDGVVTAPPAQFNPAKSFEVGIRPALDELPTGF